MTDMNPVSTPPGLIDRAKSILLKPKSEWEVIDAEPASVGSIFIGYAMILAAIPPLAGLVGGQIRRHLPGGSPELAFEAAPERVHLATFRQRQAMRATS